MADSEEPVTVDRWTSWDESEGTEEVPIGGLGGWFGFHQRNTWEDYEEMWEPEVLPYVHALRDEIVDRELREGGDWHQTAPDGVPVFSDGRIATYSYRAWGDLLAAVWEGEDGLPYSYMSFYMSPGATKEEMRADMEERPHIYHLDTVEDGDPTD